MNRTQGRERNQAANTNLHARKKEGIKYSTVICFIKNSSKVKSGLKFDALPAELTSRRQTLTHGKLSFTNITLNLRRGRLNFLFRLELFCKITQQNLVFNRIVQLERVLKSQTHGTALHTELRSVLRRFSGSLRFISKGCYEQRNRYI